MQHYSISKIYLLFPFAFLLRQPLQAQTPQVDTVQKSSSYAVLPLVFYSPETRLGLGAGAVYTFRFKGESAASRPSQVTGGAAYTLENQVLTYLSFQLFKNEERYKIYGEVGYYRYFFYFFGIGNEQMPDFSELYEIRFPRVRLNALREVLPNFYVGGQVWYDDQKMIAVDSVQGQLLGGTIAGSRGGTVAQLGLVLNYDNRNNPFFPTSGSLVEVLSAFSMAGAGADFSYQRYSLDAAHYFTLAGRHTFAVNLVGDFYVGAPPFFQMAELGGTKRMRGYYQGRFRDNNALLLQAEYRLPLFENKETGFLRDRLKVVFFGSYGNVAARLTAFEWANNRLTYGAGLRVRLTDSGIHLRLDYGRGKDTSGFYLTFGEAF